MTGTRSQPRGEPFIAIRSALVRQVSQALAGARRIAFINFPDIGNLGDAAIWLGTMDILAELGVAVAYHTRAQDLSIDAILATGPDAVVLNGGGNLGDLWAGQHQAREAVLRQLHDLPILQLSQSMWFNSRANRERFAGIAAGPRDLTMLWREQRSFDEATACLSGSHVLAHDMAFGLTPTSRIGDPITPVLALLRTDRERRIESIHAARSGIAVEDWQTSPVPTDDRIVAASSEAADLHADPLGNLPHIEALYLELARRRVSRAIKILSRGEVVITDRLHAHLLAGIAGIPSVALDNTYGKVLGVRRRSLGETEALREAASFDEALNSAMSLAGTLSRPSTGHREDDLGVPRIPSSPD